MSTKEAIIQAAAELFAEKGYDGMTMKLIAEKVGVTPPAVYAFFKNKEDLFSHIYENVLSEHYDIASRLMEALHAESVREQLYRILRGLFEFHIREELRVKIFMRLLLFPPKVFPLKLAEELNKLVEREQELYAKIFEKGIQNGELKPGDSHLYARGMICLMDGLFWQLQRYPEERFWQNLDWAWEQFWQGIAVENKTLT